MGKHSKSKLQGIFLLCAIFNVNFCVVGHPMQLGEAAHIAEGSRSVGATGHNAAENIGATSVLTHQGDGKVLETSATVSAPKSGSGDAILVGIMGKGHLENMKVLREQPNKDLLGTDEKFLASQVDDSKLTAPSPEGVKFHEQPPSLNKGPVEDTPNKALNLDTSADTATQNSDVAHGQGLKIPGQDGEETPAPQVISDASKAKDTDENLLKSTPKGGDSEFTAQGPESGEASEQLPKPNKGPVEDMPKKALNVDMSAGTATQNPKVVDGQGLKIPAQNNEETSAAHRIPEPSKENLKDTQPPSVKNTEENHLKSTPKNEPTTASVASVRPETQSKILGSAELRVKKPIGWRIKNFFKRIFSWIFRRGKYGKKNKEATTTVKPSTGDRLTEKDPSDVAPKVDVNKPVDQSETSLFKPDTQTPDISKQSEPVVSSTTVKPSTEPIPANQGKPLPDIPEQPKLEAASVKSTDSPGDANIKETPLNSANAGEPRPVISEQPPSEATSAKSADSPGDANIQETPSGFRRYLPSYPSREYLKSWLTWSGKKSPPVENKAPVVASEPAI